MPTLRNSPLFLVRPGVTREQMAHIETQCRWVAKGELPAEPGARPVRYGFVEPVDTDVDPHGLVPLPPGRPAPLTPQRGSQRLAGALPDGTFLSLDPGSHLEEAAICVGRLVAYLSQPAAPSTGDGVADSGEAQPGSAT